MAFNENSRVKIPAILHLTRLGYTYLSLKGAKPDQDTNIFPEIFAESITRINKDKELQDDDVMRLLQDISLLLDNEDLGLAFYEKLISTSEVKLIDFDNFSNNSFHVVTELTYKNGEEEFRPDITLLINGMPLAFIEVKKPNNHEGILQERDRIDRRFQNKKFRKFINISQLLVFSNNMEYDNGTVEPLQGAYYATTSYKGAQFHYFREEEIQDLTYILKPEDDALENFVLKDTNLATIKHNPDFLTNKQFHRPTNRILTSLFSKDRLAMLLRYGLTYVKGSQGIEKHIMRYPQFFATKAIEKSIESGLRKGIIWHTQGSGKTALAFYNVRYLTDYFQNKGIVPKFYFIVDRLDLLTQASKEFTSRNLLVKAVNSKEGFVHDIRNQSAIHNLQGKAEITVVNIQKFSEESNVVVQTDYNTNVQRIYFLDEVHRSYNPKGSFLANLISSDKSAIIIGLTGTPLIGKGHHSTNIFGEYIHKYYYNASIADGYTLRLIREGIETNYKMQMEEILRQIEVLAGDLKRSDIFAHPSYAEPMLDYIIEDFEKSRLMWNDSSIGAMVVCDSSDQAKQLFEIFNQKYAAAGTVAEGSVAGGYSMAAEQTATYNKAKKKKYKVTTAALILHDVGTKEDRKKLVEDFKDGRIDMLLVYNMLLTGFDAKRLKKLYLGRVVKTHNLLQTLTRVNRPYKKFRFGYVVDFADIRSEFDATNRAYYDELKGELGDEMEHYSDLFKSKEEIAEEISQIKELLFQFDTQNLENFSMQVSAMQDRQQVLDLKKALANARSLYNLIRLLGHDELIAKLDFRKINILYTEVSNHLDLLNQKEALESGADTGNLLNVALEDVLFLFRKISEAELVLADQLKNTLRKTREAMAGNFDKKDPEFTSLYEELERMFKKKNLDEITQDEMKANIDALQHIYDRVKELNRKNDLLKAKYESDAKYARVHKRLREHSATASTKDIAAIYEALQGVKQHTDEQIILNSNLLSNEGYFNQLVIKSVIDNFVKKNQIKLDPDTTQYINHCVVQEYMNEYYGRIR
ncbi:type I restriction endonuclease subunit R [Pontibacter sp. 172403-2]|uniref:type I restriction endonuclease subunit R n=1 Tax=Pontibacter rufus TaxID=2791028 RepID=UPI0018AFA20E|nr:type I restriction endonuclease [Pontibacter sp. 172403-2]MBF9254234.1 type I restriction endonuclease subunit R [Pontibacter sp. 172403-2]